MEDAICVLHFCLTISSFFIFSLVTYSLYSFRFLLKEFFKGEKNSLELIIVCRHFIFNLFKLEKNVFMRCNHFSHFCEYPDDPDIDFYSSFTVKNAGKHRDALFGETIWRMTQSHFFGIGGRNLRPPIFQLFSAVIVNIKSCGNLEMFLRTASLSRLVSTP